MEVEHMNIPGSGPEMSVLGIKGSRRVTVEAMDSNGGNSRYGTEGPTQNLVDITKSSDSILNPD